MTATEKPSDVVKQLARQDRDRRQIRDEESRRWAASHALHSLMIGGQLPATVTNDMIAARAATLLASIRPDLADKAPTRTRAAAPVIVHRLPNGAASERTAAG